MDIDELEQILIDTSGLLPGTIQQSYKWVIEVMKVACNKMLSDCKDSAENAIDLNDDDICRNKYPAYFAKELVREAIDKNLISE